MAHLLKKLGEKALHAQKHGDVWHKAAISAKNAARLRKETLLAGADWPYDQDKVEIKQKKPKGHKWEKLKKARDVQISVNLADMPRKIAEYKEEKKVKEASAVDRLLLSPKEQRMKVGRA